MLKAIFLDIDNTLLSFDGYVKQAMKSGFELFGLGTYSDDMFPVFSRINGGLWQEIERGELLFEDLKKRRWNTVFQALGINFDGEVFEDYFRKGLFESGIPENGALHLLSYLHEKYILCAASNGPYLQQVNRLKNAGMLPFFSEVFVSDEIGFSKPSAEYFKVCIERLNAKAPSPVLPCEIMIIGDSLSSDIAGGINYGLKTCFYNPLGKPAGGISPDLTVSELCEIEALI